MKGEIKSLIKVWMTVYASLTFIYFFISKIPQGKIRLIFLLPIITLFTIIPFDLTSVHLRGTTSFFITWLCNFKLLLFAFNQGPLSSKPSISFIHFISIATLPIKIKDNPFFQTPQNIKNIKKQKHLSYEITKNKGLKSPLNYAIKVLLFAFVLETYNYKQYMHQNLILGLYCCHIYLSVELTLALGAAPARAMGFELEPQFEDPYLSTSLQDFWGRRWNLMVTSILRPTVYGPIRSISIRILGRKYSIIPAVMGAFLVSGLMHELIYFYMTNVDPTWEVTWFFVIHGACLVLEIAAKKALGDKWRLHPMISGPLAIGFIAVTAFWLFFPQLVQNGVDVKAILEYGELVKFVKDEIVKPLSLRFRFALHNGWRNMLPSLRCAKKDAQQRLLGVLAWAESPLGSLGAEVSSTLSPALATAICMSLGDMSLCTSWDLYGFGDWREEDDSGEVAVAHGDFWTIDYWVHSSLTIFGWVFLSSYKMVNAKAIQEYNEMIEFVKKEVLMPFECETEIFSFEAI